MSTRVTHDGLRAGTKAAAILATIAMLLAIVVPQTSAIASPGNSGNTPAQGGSPDPVDPDPGFGTYDSGNTATTTCTDLDTATGEPAKVAPARTAT